MKCPRCQTGNPETRKFCRECGARLFLLCPECGLENAPDDKFCGECGHALQKPVDPPPIDYSQPQSYTPKFLADKILTTRSSIEGERKLVTILFADVANYTSISEKLDPEEVHQLMDGCFKILMDEIHRYEGTVNQFAGDGVMALFGAPVAHEDHAQRACYAALSIQKAMNKYSEKIRKECGRKFRLRVGLNTGSVVVGSVGDDLRMDYTAVGDTTNLASRLQGMAKPGTVLVSKHTYRNAKDFFLFESLGKVKVKGKETLAEPYELLRPSEVETRLEAAAAKGLTKFVGRRKEIETLREAFENAKSGSGQVMGVVGEAGVGKSRLLLEFRGTIPPGEYTFLEGRCLHYGSSMPYLPILDVLKGYFDVKEEDREEAIKKKLGERLRDLDERAEIIAPALHEVLSLQVEDEKYLQLGPQQRRHRTFEAIRDLFIRESQRKPLVLAVEDLHWIDKTSEEFLDYLIGLLPTTGILLILLYRPEYTHTWGSKSCYGRIGLDQLSAQTRSELVQAILEGGDVSPEISGLVLGRAGGNPLFVEELTHSLVENGSIQKKDHQFVLAHKPSEIEVPDTIQGIITARMDRIEDDLKRIMQMASVIGREFAYRILQAITGLSEDLKMSLLDLQRLEFIHEKQLLPELEYIFKHVLTQEVAYNSMLLKKRREFHEKIAMAIETIYAERLEEYYELLAHHYKVSKNQDKAVDYLDLASQKAQKNSAMEEAKAFFDQAMELLDTLPDSGKNREKRISLLVKQGIPFMNLLRMPEYYDLLTRHKPKADRLENPRLVGAFSSRLAQCEFIFGLFDQAIQTATRAAELCELAGNEEDAAFAYTVSQWSHLYKCEFDQVILLKEDILRNTTKSFSLVAHVRALTGASMAYGSIAQWDKAIDEGQKAMKIAQEYSNTSLISWAAYILTIIYLYKGDLGRAMEYGELGVEVAPTLADKVWAQSALSWAWCRSGDADKGIEFLVTYVEMAKITRTMPAQLNGMTWLTEGYCLVGEFDKARPIAEELVQITDRTGMTTYLGWAHYLLGQTYVESDPKQAVANFEKAIVTLFDTKADNRLAMVYAGYGRFHRRQGRIEEAREYLTKALEIFQRLGTLIEPDMARSDLAGLPTQEVPSPSPSTSSHLCDRNGHNAKER